MSQGPPTSLKLAHLCLCLGTPSLDKRPPSMQRDHSHLTVFHKQGRTLLQSLTPQSHASVPFFPIRRDDSFSPQPTASNPGMKWL